MKKIALLALVVTTISAPAFSQTAPSPSAGVPNPVNPGGTTPQQTAPSVAGGVPNPITPFGVDPRTLLPPSSPFGQTALPNPQNLPLETPEPHLTPLGQAAVQNPIGRSHPLVSSPNMTNTLATPPQAAPNQAESETCGWACSGEVE
jgi:hypothetical protein